MTEFQAPKNGRTFMGFSVPQVVLGMALFVLLGGGVFFVAFQQYAVGLIHTHAPYIKDKDVIEKTLDAHEISIDRLETKFHKIDKQLDIVINNQERILKKVD